jgi:hypothetical protein
MDYNSFIGLGVTIIVAAIVVCLVFNLAKKLNAKIDSSPDQKYIIEAVIHLLKTIAALNLNQSGEVNPLTILSSACNEAVKFIEQTCFDASNEQKKAYAVDTVMRTLAELSQIEQLKPYELDKISRDLVEVMIESSVLWMNTTLLDKTDKY